MPTPRPRSQKLQPGGTDALPEDPADNGLGRDLYPYDNPAVDDALPDGIAEPDEKSQAPDESSEAGSDEGSSLALLRLQSARTPRGERRRPGRGQTAEDGSAEPPA